MMKKIALTSVLSIIVISLLVGCSGGSYLLLLGGIDKTDTSLSGDYSEFDGHYYITRTFEKGDKVTFAFTEDTEEGTIKAQLVNEAEDITEVIHNQTEITINKTQNYKIKVIGNDHKGQFNLQWSIED